MPQGGTGRGAMSVELVVVVQVLVMLYAVRAVCREDQRRPSADRRRALRHIMWWALAVLIVAAALQIESGGRRYVLTRDMWHWGLIAAAITTALAVRLLAGDRRR